MNLEIERLLTCPSAVRVVNGIERRLLSVRTLSGRRTRMNGAYARICVPDVAPFRAAAHLTSDANSYIAHAAGPEGMPLPIEYS